MSDTYRPPISKKRQAMLDKIAKRLTDEGLLEFTRHNALDLAVDWFYAKMFPGEAMPEHKKYFRIDF
jgi:hypothetical protein